MGSGLKEPTSLTYHFVPLQIQQMMSYPVGGSPFISKCTEVLPRENRTCFSHERICGGEEEGNIRAVTKTRGAFHTVLIDFLPIKPTELKLKLKRDLFLCKNTSLHLLTSHGYTVLLWHAPESHSSAWCSA